MTFHRRKFMHLAGGAVAVTAVSRIAQADDYPARPVRVVVNLPAGLAPDVMARVVSDPRAQRLGQPGIVENRPGASGNIGTEYVVRSAPDGYTLMAAISGNAVNATLYKDLSFNFVRDVAAVAFIAYTPFVLTVTPSFPAKTIPEFIAYARANPGKINLATVGPGSGPYMSGELFKMMTGTDMVEVQYRSNYFPDVLSGQVQGTLAAVAPSIGFIKAGKLRPLGVTSAARMDVLPDVPPIADFVPGYEGSGWIGICAPKGTPNDVVEKLNKDINAIIADPAIKARFADLGGTLEQMTPAQFDKLIADAAEKWGKVIKFGNIKPE
jgi:tripartite-type tricarboxylate transporter receptor subunit TctC